MQEETREDRRRVERAAKAKPELGFIRTPYEADPRRDGKLLAAISRVAPGTDLRQGIDDIIRSRAGALIVVGDPEKLAFLYSGGLRLDQPLTPQFLYELAKMDGAIIIDSGLTRIAYANVQLMPDPTIASAETGTRHRTAERVAKQTEALVLSISQQRETVTLFLGDRRYQLDSIADLLARTNQALHTLETYRQRFEQVKTRLTALEFQNAVMLDDVLVALQRAEMTMRMAEEIERDCIELGSEGRVIEMQLGELIAGVPKELTLLIADYHASADRADHRSAEAQLRGVPYQALLVFEQLTELLGYPETVDPVDHALTARGYRVLSQIPRVPDAVVRQVVAGLPGLDAIVRASQRDLEGVSGVGEVRAREIKDGLRRLQEQNLVDRYLQL
jgi:diadenylate cyclase